MPPPVVLATADELVLPTDGDAVVFRGTANTTPTVWPYLNTVQRSNGATREFTLSIERDFDEGPQASTYRLTTRGLERFELGTWYVEWPATLRSGEITVTMDRVVSTVPDIDLDGKPETFEVSERLEVLGTQFVQTRVGLFPDAVGLRRFRTQTLTRSAGGVRTSTTQFDTWYARGFGPVKRQRAVTAFGGTQTLVEELIGFRSGGKAAGLSPATPVRAEAALELGNIAAGTLAGRALVVSSSGGISNNLPKVVGSLIDQTGAVEQTVTLVPEEPVQMINTVAALDVAAGPDRFMMLAYRDGRVLVRMVDPASPTTSPPATVVAQSSAQFEIKTPRIAYVDGRFLAVWIEDFPSTVVKGRFVTLDGDVDGPAFVIQTLDVRQLRADQLAVAAGPNMLLLAFESYRDEIVNSVVWFDPSVRALRVGFDGVALDAQPIVIADADRGQGRPDVAWHNGNFWVSWLDSRDPSASYFEYLTPLRFSQPYVARVRPDGTLVDGDAATGGKRISREWTIFGDVKIKTTRNGVMLARYVRPDFAAYSGFYYTLLNDDASPVATSPALEIAANEVSNTTVQVAWSSRKLLLFELADCLGIGAWVGPRDDAGNTPGRINVVYLHGLLPTASVASGGAGTSR